VTGNLIARYDLGEDFSSETAVQFGSIYKREDGAFAFKAVGAGYNFGLDTFVKGYGGIL
jgi:tellurium resistance protein TerD